MTIRKVLEVCKVQVYVLVGDTGMDRENELRDWMRSCRRERRTPGLVEDVEHHE